MDLLLAEFFPSYFIFGLICALLSCRMAKSMNKSQILWFFLGYIFSIVTVIALAAALPGKDRPKF